MEAFEIDGLEASRLAAGQLYHEFLRQDSMSAGLYVVGQDAYSAPRKTFDTSIPFCDCVIDDPLCTGLITSDIRRYAERLHDVAFEIDN